MSISTLTLIIMILAILLCFGIQEVYSRRTIAQKNLKSLPQRNAHKTLIFGLIVSILFVLLILIQYLSFGTSQYAWDSVSTNISTSAKTVEATQNFPAKRKFSFNQKHCFHFRYEIANSKNLMTIGSYGLGNRQRFEQLDFEAGEALMMMIDAARNVGIWLVPASAFRDLERQKQLFQRKVQQLGSEDAAAIVSAPPGYSEHHTGLAVDLVDGHFPEGDISISFEKTNAYLWLTHHAEEFGFELSFPLNNLQGVSYEPWHWRYVGSPKSSEVFLAARQLK